MYILFLIIFNHLKKNWFADENGKKGSSKSKFTTESRKQERSIPTRIEQTLAKQWSLQQVNFQNALVPKVSKLGLLVPIFEWHLG